MAAEGIMTLAQPSAPQGPMPTAPQQMDPAMQQQAMQAFMDQDPEEFEQGVDENIAEDPALAQQLQQILSTMGLTQEVKDALLTVIDAIFENPGEYAEIRQELLAAGFPEELLPENLDIEFFSTLRFALLRAPVSEPVQQFRDGGPVSLKPVAQFLQEQGRNGDTLLAHINPQEAAMLKRMGGSGTINPVTGLREYNFFKKVGRAVEKGVKSVAKAVVNVVKPVINAVKAVVKPITDGVKKLLSNPIIRGIATVAAAVFFAPIAAPVLAGFGITGAVATGVTAMATTTGIGLLAGEKPKDALKQGLAAGVTAGFIDYGATKLGDFFASSPVDPTGAGNVGAAGNVQTAGNVQAPGGVDKYLQPGAKPTGFVELRSAASTPPPPPPPPTGFFDKAVNVAKDVGKGALKTVGDIGKTAATTIGTGYLLQQLGGKEPPPNPDDVPGGGPTGMDLLMEDPAKYGVTIGDVSTSYINPPLGQGTSPTGNQGTPFGTVANISVGAPVETTPSPGVTPGLPNVPSSMPFQVATPDFSTAMSSTPSFEKFGQATGPSPEELANPNSPFYNPFAAQLAMMNTSAPAQPQIRAFAKGGIVSVQKFAKGGKVVGRTARGAPIYASSKTGGHSTTATKTKAQLEALNRSKSSQKTRSQEAQRRAATTESARVAENKAARERAAQAERDKQARARAQEAARQGAAEEAKRRNEEQARVAREKIEQEAQQRAAQQAEQARIRAQQEEQARLQGIAEAARIRQQEEDARVRAEQQAQVMAQQRAREAEQARINQGVADYRTMFASGLTPTIQDQAIAAALETDRAANPRSYMTSFQIADLDAEEAMKKQLASIAEQQRLYDLEQANVAKERERQATLEMARLAEQRRVFDLQQAADAKERERQATLAKAAADFEEYKKSLSTPAPAVTTTPSLTAPISTGGGSGISIAPGGIGTTAPSTPTVAPPTTTAPPTFSVPMINPPFDLTSTPNPFGPVARTSVPNTDPTIYRYGPGNELIYSGPQSGAPAMFAQGGIAAMAPSRFRTGSPASGVMNFPRKTGPINGPGTGTSDSIPAMLSDGEFVFTAKAVRNFGNGSRREGAKKMYQMMKALERKS